MIQFCTKSLNSLKWFITIKKDLMELQNLIFATVFFTTQKLSDVFMPCVKVGVRIIKSYTKSFVMINDKLSASELQFLVVIY
jgi:hypothetical protein